VGGVGDKPRGHRLHPLVRVKRLQVATATVAARALNDSNGQVKSASIPESVAVCDHTAS